MIRRWIAGVALLAIATTSCAATWRVNYTAPATENQGTCAAPVLVPSAGGLLRITLSWSGPQSGSITHVVAPGVADQFSGVGPSGLYTFTASAADSLGNVLCDTTLTFQAKGKPTKISDVRVN